jgi:hypothetical protein
MGTGKGGGFWSAHAPAALSSGVIESGTFVPRSKTLRAQGGSAPYRRPSFESPVAACHFDIHAAILADPGTNKKPTVVF